MALILTRSAPGIEKTAKYLQAHGVLNIQCFPLLRFASQATCAGVMAHLADATDVIFTSANGVRAVGKALAQAPEKLISQNYRVWCVGAATADIARAHGWVHVRSSEGNAQDLAAYILANIIEDRPRKCVHFANAVASNNLVETLAEKRIEAQKYDAYEMCPVLNSGVLSILSTSKSTPPHFVFHSKAAANVFVNLWQKASPKSVHKLKDARAIVYAAHIGDVIQHIFGDICVLARPNDKALLEDLKR